MVLKQKPIKMKKRAKVHLLPTDKASDILVNTYINETHSTSKFVVGVTKDTLDQIPIEEVELRGYKYQHLYFINDEEIKDEEWFVQFNNANEPVDVRQADSSKLNDFREYPYNKFCKKIIATTDPELYYKQQNGHLGQAIIQVPQIPQSFIESYCKKPVDKVMVEYDYYADGKISILDRIMIPKLTSNNEIIIHHIEEKMYSETELIQFVLDNRFRIDSDTTRQEITNWIKK